MEKTITYKLQGDNSDSWEIREFDDDGKLLNAYMVTERPAGHADTLVQAYEIKKGLIDERTQELIFKGFAFGGLTWSLSLTAQINWSNLPILPEAIFPLSLQDINDQVYSLTYANRISFYLTAVNTKNTHLQSGGALKRQVSLLTNIDEILNFNDPR